MQTKRLLLTMIAVRVGRKYGIPIVAAGALVAFVHSVPVAGESVASGLAEPCGIEKTKVVLGTHPLLLLLLLLLLLFHLSSMYPFAPSVPDGTRGEAIVEDGVAKRLRNR